MQEEMLHLGHKKSTEQKRYYSADEFENPFFVVVHAESSFPKKQNELRERIMSEIEEIKRNYDWVSLNGSPWSIPDGLPINRPILVCGFFDHICVQEHRDFLLGYRYEAYISKKGTY